MSKRIHNNDVADIEALFIGRKIVAVDTGADTLTLDDGRVIEVAGNDGCGWCASGNYWAEVLNKCDNIITSVGVAEERDADDDEIDLIDLFVFADNEKINIVHAEGSVGNGYYGWGFNLRVRA